MDNGFHAIAHVSYAPVATRMQIHPALPPRCAELHKQLLTAAADKPPERLSHATIAHGGPDGGACSTTVSEFRANHVCGVPTGTPHPHSR